jgi:helix-turn-helix protein
VSIGEALAQARHQAGLTVTQVSQQTRIRETIITGIEGDDYSACGGDSYAHGYIRSIARAVGADAEPLIEEYDTARQGTQADTDDTSDPFAPIRIPRRLRLNWIAVLVLVWLGIAAYDLIVISPGATGAAPSAGAHPVTHRTAGRGTPVPSAPAASPPGTVRVRTLTPASAAAFNPYGSGQGDHADLAPLAIDGNPASAWRSDWYTTARFGNLYPGTGLLVDMGGPTTITAARVTLGRARGAGFQLRVGAAPALADLRPVAHAADTGGVVHLRLATPAHGRYVLIWFTRLPPDSAGTFQVSVRNLWLGDRA